MSDKITVLGTEYTLEERNFDDDRKLHDAYGYIEPNTKKIIVRKIVTDCLTVEKVERIHDEVLRHEIVHAFFLESGMTDWYEDEKLVEWIAMQLPKMVIAMKEAGAIQNADG